MIPLNTEDILMLHQAPQSPREDFPRRIAMGIRELVKTMLTTEGGRVFP